MHLKWCPISLGQRLSLTLEHDAKFGGPPMGKQKPIPRPSSHSSPRSISTTAQQQKNTAAKKQLAQSRRYPTKTIKQKLDHRNDPPAEVLKELADLTGLTRRKVWDWFNRARERAKPLEERRWAREVKPKREEKKRSARERVQKKMSAREKAKKAKKEADEKGADEEEEEEEENEGGDEEMEEEGGDEEMEISRTLPKNCLVSTMGRGGKAEFLHQE
ncbi:hypothetical protein HYALB_00012927 [Hymenoscyphus albidus]|uniref:Homeobox domain-containing protein n=1 Tax=Hymenoscyphus albidus TaxID=595503 RepID=A0A9N9LWL8_9HELO|nr:hypothetical protein HYALB_00012927 [Hymenoscyphus albidus]